MSSVTRTAAAGAAVLVLVATAAGCSSSGTSASASSHSANHASGKTVQGTVVQSGTFGPACASVPKSGPGSFSGMASQPVATAASHNPALTTLVRAINAAGLASILDNTPNITVFAPDNSAFAKIPGSTLNTLLANKTQLSRVLRYHVVKGRLSPKQLAGTHTTLEGSTLRVTGSGTNFTVNGDSTVVCGNVQTSNATVYIIDGVLMPPAGSGAPGASPSASPSASPTASPTGTSTPTASPTGTSSPTGTVSPTGTPSS